MHGAILRRSRLARAFFHLYGVLVLTPPRGWRETHNYHHAHTGQLVGSQIGSFWTVSLPMWWQMKPAHRLLYRMVRHPITIAFAYLTVFLWGMCASSLLRSPRKHWDSAVALVVHAAASLALVHFAGAATWLAVLLLPLALACALGAYLFYAQHNFPGVGIRPREAWSWTAAALESSSYMEMGPVMRWFTANIGYHHVHHLNPAIPFYRLPEAMAAVPELARPRRTSLWPRDVFECLRLAVWDPREARMLTPPEARATRSTWDARGRRSRPA
jgi:omega-6 fatty acid desaturase (delta-12 desaturase)